MRTRRIGRTGLRPGRGRAAGGDAGAGAAEAYRTGEARAYRRAALAAPVLAVAAVLALAGCGGGGGTANAVASADGKGKATSAPAGDQQKAYRTCMEGEGVPMYLSSEGVAVVDKDKADSGKVTAATAKCGSLQPTATEGAPPSAEDIAKRRELSECIRQHGVPDYPDPDPVTGEVEESASLAASLKADPKLQPALDACQASQPTGAPAGDGGQPTGAPAGDGG